MFDNYIYVLPFLPRDDICTPIEILCQLSLSCESPFASHVEKEEVSHSEVAFLTPNQNTRSVCID